MPNHYYFYLLDEDFDPQSIKFCSYFEQETLRFMIDARVPFTKNQGENDIRMAKVHLDGKLPEFIL